MLFYSTNGISPKVDLKEAVLSGLPLDNGLFMPESLPLLPSSFIDNLSEYPLSDIGFELSKALFDGFIPDTDLLEIVSKAINFDAPLHSLSSDTHILELFHGPSLAFKDFGARYMAQLMGYFNRNEDNELLILVATSGDTGGAVASGFVGIEGIKVVILYPSGKVSPLQEKQLTTHGQNIQAIEVDGTFDDCQDLVKSAFLDTDLQAGLRLTSANSINIARLIPQTFYYFEAYKQLKSNREDVYFSIPSGNFGNLTAGLFAKRMGLPIAGFLAATNVNDVVPRYLKTGVYAPKAARRTISNAMDVGNPSNFRRMEDLYCSTWNNIIEDIHGFSFTDAHTEGEMRSVYLAHNYIIDPHGAIGSLAWKSFLSANPTLNGQCIILETAHPAKFREDVERILTSEIVLPSNLSRLLPLEKQAVFMDSDFSRFKNFLLSEY